MALSDWGRHRQRCKCRVGSREQRIFRNHQKLSPMTGPAPRLALAPLLTCSTILDMIHIADTKVARRYGDFFIRQIHKFEEQWWLTGIQIHLSSPRVTALNSTPESPSSCQSLLSPLWRLCQVKVCGQPLSTPPTLLGNGPFQKPKVTDTVYVPSLGPFPSGLVQVQWQCWPASSPCEGTGTAELRLVLTALGMQGIQQLQPTPGFLSLLPGVEEASCCPKPPLLRSHNAPLVHSSAKLPPREQLRAQGMNKARIPGHSGQTHTEPCWTKSRKKSVSLRCQDPAPLLGDLQLF
ncbi:hypothetical protein QTO34_018013 [Cnephaeus nilssonii]|uniref:Uncharacterized protein n=1 Tax=Cnephaeus nilssonii TaxID=3371016 RepID=A0AA40I229_CNENI|nr:hypothetical protein QTO34_018013 [Eptesicus nilssonii]